MVEVVENGVQGVSEPSRSRLRIKYSDLQKKVAKNHDILLYEVEDILSTYTDVCLGQVRLGYSLSLTDDVFVRVNREGSLASVVLPRSYLFNLTAKGLEEQGKPVTSLKVQGVLEAYQAEMLSWVSDGYTATIFNLVTYNPNASQSWLRVRLGAQVRSLVSDCGYSSRLVVSERLQALVRR